jgi:two-component system, chemotaxis family, protein-glutamate methylesterase/glutaminase
MQNRDILAIGASAGGVAALLHLAAALPADFPASILVTLHLSKQFRSSLDELLTRAGSLKATFAGDGDRLQPGRIYIAPPDRHLLIENDRIALGFGPRENHSRPAIDPMLRSAALCCGHRTIGVVLTGTLGDGASGLWTIGECGGITVVQDPRSAAFAEMPETALQLLRPDHVVDLEHMPDLFERLVQQPSGELRRPPPGVRFEVDAAKGDKGNSMKELDAIGRRSVVSCPDCQGVMWEIDEGALTRYRCHVGHTYASDLLNLALDENLRRALGSAQRALEERVALAGRLYGQAERSGRRHLMDTWSAHCSEYEQEMTVIRDAILRMEDIAAREELRRIGVRTGT